jgi:hypothetical protein
MCRSFVLRRIEESSSGESDVERDSFYVGLCTQMNAYGGLTSEEGITFSFHEYSSISVPVIAMICSSMPNIAH